jgi:hypothetical protein
MCKSPSRLEISESSLGFKEHQRVESIDGHLIALCGAKEGIGFTYRIYIWDLSDYEYIDKGYWSEHELGGYFQSLNEATSEAKRYIDTHEPSSKI